MGAAWSGEGTMDPDTMLHEIEHLFTVIKETWSYLVWNRERIGLDLDVLKDRHLSSSLQSPLTFEAYFDVLKRIAAELQDGHIHIKNQHGLQRKAAMLPAALKLYGKGLYISKVTRPECWDRLPQPGDRVISINDEPISSLLDYLAVRTPASTRRHLWSRIEQNLFLSSAEGQEMSEATIIVEKPDGNQVNTLFDPSQEVKDVTNPINLDWVNESVAHIRIPSFVPGHWFPDEEGSQLLPGQDPRIPKCIALIDQVFEEVARAKTLILDLRGNGGGTDTLGQHVAKHLLPSGFVYFHLMTRHSEVQARNHLKVMKHLAKNHSLPGMSPEQAKYLLDLDEDSADPAKFGLPTSGWSPRHTQQPVFGQKVDTFTGQLILLIDGACFSTTDNLIACIQDQRPDAILLGSGTGGGSGAPATAVLPHTKATVSICTMKVYRPNGGLIEGIGSEPDIGVKATPEDLRRGRDRVLEAALKLL